MTEPMTRRDREELQKIARLRAKVARDGVAEREAHLRAEAEEQLSAAYRFDDSVWTDITSAAKAAVAAADEQVAARCRELGVPERFRPGLNIGWYTRGENAAASRRAELRRLAEARISAAGKQARTAIDKRTADVLTQLIAGGLESDQARAHLESIPTADQLMPAVNIAELEATTSPPQGDNRYGLEDNEYVVAGDPGPCPPTT